MKYEIFKEKNIKINLKDIDNIIKKFAKLFKISPKNYLSIAFVSPNAIKKINYQYRKIDKITDVLSFGNQLTSPLTRGVGGVISNKDLKFFDSNFIGEIIICYKQASCQAKENGVGANKEIQKLLTHGMVHLMGYDHKTSKDEKKMHNKEAEILGHQALSF
ncbi:MAG: rRNA maturation RNase YbeY [bacterium]